MRMVLLVISTPTHPVTTCDGEDLKGRRAIKTNYFNLGDADMGKWRCWALGAKLAHFRLHGFIYLAHELGKEFAKLSTALLTTATLNRKGGATEK